MQVLSVDLASTNPHDLGIAVLRAGDKISVELVPPEVLKLTKPLQAPSLADALIDLAEASECRWIALDGPSGWKHPENGLVHSRVSDKELNSPAKVGLPGQVKPYPYTAFIEFSISVFDALHDRGYLRLTDTATASDKTAVEILPLVCWPLLQLPKLPAKAKTKPHSLAACVEALSTLVTFDCAPNHDELQATVAGVAVLWRLLGKHSQVRLAGHPPVLLGGHWREGYILAPAKTFSAAPSIAAIGAGPNATKSTARGARYVHCNLIAHDWRRLADFYERVFGCRQVPPTRNLSGEWLERGTGVADARLEGVHLRLPGQGSDGPTLEIYTYSVVVEQAGPVANRAGYGHLAFAVDDVRQAVSAVIGAGGTAVGEVVATVVEGRGRIEFAYVRDPEGNIIELQRWFAAQT